MPDSRSFARKSTAVSLVLAPLLLLIGVLIGPDLSDDAAERLREIADDKGLTVAGSVFFLLAPWVFIPGMVGLIHLLRGPRVNLGQIAAGALLLGALATTIFYGLSGVEYVAATDQDLNRDEMADLLDAGEDSAFFAPMIVVFLGGVVLGGVVLGIVLWRRGVVPIWAGLAVTLSALVGFFSQGKWDGAVGFLLLLVGLTAVAMRIWSMSDEEWARWEPLPERSRGGDPPAAPEATGASPRSP